MKLYMVTIAYIVSITELKLPCRLYPPRQVLTKHSITSYSLSKLNKGKHYYKVTSPDTVYIGLHNRESCDQIFLSDDGQIFEEPSNI